jgi:hypothetical protein
MSWYEHWGDDAAEELGLCHVRRTTTDVVGSGSIIAHTKKGTEPTMIVIQQRDCRQVRVRRRKPRSR